MGAIEDTIINHLIDRSAEVLENTFYTFQMLEKRGNRRAMERLVGTYCRMNNLPIPTLPAFIHCLEEAHRRIHFFADPDEDRRSQIKIAKDPDPLGYWKNQ